jgi:hypothetical protein
VLAPVAPQFVWRRAATGASWSSGRPASTSWASSDELGIKHGGIAEDTHGFGLSFRDLDSIALELWAPRS